MFLHTSRLGQVRAGAFDSGAVVKAMQALVALAGLKYVADDCQIILVKAYCTVMKSGVAFISSTQKYENAGKIPTQRLAIDKGDKMLSRLASTLLAYVGAVSSFASAVESAQGPSGLPSDSPLKSLSAQQQLFAESDDSARFAVFFDALGLQSTHLKQQLTQCGENVMKLSYGLWKGCDDFWRKDIGDDDDFVKVKNHAKAALKKLDGPQLKTAVESMQQAFWVG